MPFEPYPCDYTSPVTFRILDSLGKEAHQPTSMDPNSFVMVPAVEEAISVSHSADKRLSPCVRYKIWECRYIHKMKYSDIVNVTGASRGACHNYAKEYQRNPPVDLILQFNPSLVGLLPL
ncbi:hypothetical protein DM01DRAFT_1375944 [Hesseltinella vesiculosa]|uniref:Uncharacterized protein n=1 Tax=Hesseltinella vesiculosa TaxID=101127 RepID=A0A1X2GBQ9_9FUNG|nr:hypothetical protein DM01DRAFT_1379085 [Hesseltinella vesiculosa]ORX50095.1 hypothetical protein DM01DRAFT_1375944 [Hesseltinella vesiculosa]